MKKYLFFIVCSFIGFSLCAQNLTGNVFNDEDEYLFGATIMYDGTDIGTVADENGYFELPKMDTTAYLAINYVGYESVFIEVLPEEMDVQIMIAGITELVTVEVAANIRDNYVSTLSTFNVESISSNELRKAPCCNLAESFQTNAAVDVSYSDAVTGAKEIMMLGLRGAYTQVLVEKRPGMTGLGTPFSLEYIPGTWLESIQISKGAGTVQNGYQSITGQINTELVKPWRDKPVFVNAYGSTFGRGEVNMHLNKEINDKWSTGLLLHGSTRKNQLDGNNDGFYDTPQKTLVDGLFRVFYRGDLFRSQINVHALSDRHFAGQIVPEGGNQSDFYRIEQDHDRVELFGKFGYLGFDNPDASIGFIANASWHQLNSFYGRRFHQGTQQNAYASLLYSTKVKNQSNKLDLGASYLYDQYDEIFDDVDFSRLESVPGAFLEYSYVPARDKSAAELEKEPYRLKNKFGMVLGARLDYHNLFGVLFTPRANMKYNFSDESVVRISAGRGYRTANVIAENIGALASSRVIVVANDLDMEDAWNYGINFTQNFKIAGRDASISTDLYHTNFTNQVIMDMDSDYREVNFYNLDGKSFANSGLAVFSYELLTGLDMKLAYKFNDVKTTFRGNLTSQPMVAKHRGLVTLDYKTPNGKWEASVNSQLVGKSRFADVIGNPYHTDEQHTGETSRYALVNAQLTHNIGESLEIYMGGENLTNFRQENPIINWQNPFGEYFDATHIYAPITGTMGYIGVRWGIAKK